MEFKKFMRNQNAQTENLHQISSKQMQEITGESLNNCYELLCNYAGIITKIENIPNSNPELVSLIAVIISQVLVSHRLLFNYNRSSQDRDMATPPLVLLSLVIA